MFSQCMYNRNSEKHFSYLVKTMSTFCLTYWEKLNHGYKQSSEFWQDLINSFGGEKEFHSFELEKQIGLQFSDHQN